MSCRSTGRSPFVQATLEASLTEARDLTQQWVDHSNNQEKQFQASSAELEQRIQQLQQEVAASKNELVLFKEQVASAQNSWLPLWLQIRVTDAVDKVKEFAVQVTTGQTDNELTLNLHKGYKSAAAAVHTGYVAVEPHLITAKAKLSELYAQVRHRHCCSLRRQFMHHRLISQHQSMQQPSMQQSKAMPCHFPPPCMCSHGTHSTNQSPACPCCCSCCPFRCPRYQLQSFRTCCKHTKSPS
jgi:hypothetical protein